nr:hypothetical protein [Streptomyces paromomycinus]
MKVIGSGTDDPDFATELSRRIGNHDMQSTSTASPSESGKTTSVPMRQELSATTRPSKATTERAVAKAAPGTVRLHHGRLPPRRPHRGADAANGGSSPHRFAPSETMAFLDENDVVIGFTDDSHTFVLSLTSPGPAHPDRPRLHRSPAQRPGPPAALAATRLPASGFRAFTGALARLRLVANISPTREPAPVDFAHGFGPVATVECDRRYERAPRGAPAWPGKNGEGHPAAAAGCPSQRGAVLMSGRAGPHRGA